MSSGEELSELRWRLTNVGNPGQAAQMLINAHIMSVVGGETVRLRVVETEGYGTPADGCWPDPAAHSYPGVTQRNSVMFGPAGHLYVYLSYGIHMCANVTIGSPGVGAGVLLRAAHVEEGEDVVRRRRGPVGRQASRSSLASGPGRCGQAMGVDVTFYATDLCNQASVIRLLPHTVGTAEAREVMSGPRIGITKAKDVPWRRWLRDDDAVSRLSSRTRTSRSRGGVTP